MNLSDSSQQKHLLLPKLVEGNGIDPGTAGEWNIRSFDTYEKVAKGLSIEDNNGDLNRVTAIPNMWGRALCVESALYLDNSKLRSAILTQWEGMIAAIALSEIYGGGAKLTSVLLDLTQEHTGKKKKFVSALTDLMPFSFEDRALYISSDITKKGGSNPWQKIFILFWDGKPVGATSPSTIVWPSEEGKWDGIPWWDSKEKKFIPPSTKISDPLIKAQLALWLGKLHASFSDENNSTIKGLIDSFRSKICDPLPSGSLKLSDHHRIFGEEINEFKILHLLDKPIAILPRMSNVEVISNDRNPSRKMLILDHSLLEQWGLKKRPEEICVEDALNYSQLDKLIANRPKSKNFLVTPDDLLLPENNFYYVEQENVLENAWLPLSSEGLSIENPLNNTEEIAITPLLPFKAALLDYFSPEELVKMTTIEILPSGRMSLTLKLKLSGNGNDGRDYIIRREYVIKKENAKKEVPVLEVWPNFIDQSSAWKIYYLFYRVKANDSTGTFDVKIPDCNTVKEFTDPINKCKIATLEKFPEYLICMDGGQEVGVIFPKASSIINSQEHNISWTVGVDFGTSFTNVAFNSNTSEPPQQISLTSLLLSVTESKADIRSLALSEFFIAEDDMKFPLSTMITTRPNDVPITENYKIELTNVILDGRIYVPSVQESFNPTYPHIGTGLKWSADQKRQRIFLKHLILEILAHAVSRRVNNIQWALSYPTAFREQVEGAYQQTWNDLTTGDLGEDKTGIKQEQPSKSRQNGKGTYFQTESLALAQYFSSSPQDNKSFDRVVCIDVGGGTSDISIWANSKLQYQCSVRFAGRNLFTQVLKKYPDLLSICFDLSRGLLDGCDSEQNYTLSDDNIDAKLEALMRVFSIEWMNKKVHVNEQRYQEFLSILALGWCGLYYYIGLILKVLQDEKKIPSTESLVSSVYIGGNGSRLLHWLSEGPTFSTGSKINNLLSRMLACGAQINDVRGFRVKTELSKDPKGEVCYGLVFDIKKSRLEESLEIDNSVIAGEFYRMEGISSNESEDIDLAYKRLPKGSLEGLLSSDFKILPKFLYDFNQSLEDIQSQQKVLNKISSIGKLLEKSSNIVNYKSESAVADDNLGLWEAVSTKLYGYMDQSQANQIEEIGSPYILGLKSLIDVLAEEWARKWKE
jgi:hypothetical protein